MDCGWVRWLARLCLVAVAAVLRDSLRLGCMYLLMVWA